MADIVGSVGIRNGKQCHNRVADQQTVMDLLNRIPFSSGGAMQLGGVRTVFDPPRPGIASRQLHQAILHFQKTNQHEGLFVDGHVDPGYRCIQLMQEMAAQPKVAVAESTLFTIAFFDEPRHPSVSPGVLIAALGDTGGKTASYQLQPRSFASAFATKLNLAGTGQYSLRPFQTPEPLAPDRFTGPVAAVEYINTGISVVIRFFFMGVRQDGGTVRVWVDFGADVSTVKEDTLYGSMILDPAAQGSNLPLIQRTALHRPSFRRPA